MYSEHSHNNGRESTLAVLSLNQNREAYRNEGAYILLTDNNFKKGRFLERGRLLERGRFLEGGR